MVQSGKQNLTKNETTLKYYIGTPMFMTLN
jgi:hypothetical protein